MAKERLAQEKIGQWLEQYPLMRTELAARGWHAIIPELRQEYWFREDGIRIHRWGTIEEYTTQTPNIGANTWADTPNKQQQPNIQH